MQVLLVCAPTSFAHAKVTTNHANESLVVDEGVFRAYMKRIETSLARLLVLEPPSKPFLPHPGEFASLRHSITSVNEGQALLPSDWVRSVTCFLSTVDRSGDKNSKFEYI